MVDKIRIFAKLRQIDRNRTKYDGGSAQKGKVKDTMLVITDGASTELKKALDSEMAKNKHLLLYFQGVG